MDLPEARFGEGSPPRVRGKGEVEDEPEVEPGITPACAGKRHGILAHAFRMWDHPRMRGEKQ